MSDRPKTPPPGEGSQAPLKEGEDFVYDEQGLMVLTRSFLLKRGYCCKSGCRNCPYGFGGTDRG